MMFNTSVSALFATEDSVWLTGNVPYAMTQLIALACDLRGLLVSSFAKAYYSDQWQTPV